MNKFLHKLSSVYVKEISNSLDNLKALLTEFPDLFIIKVCEIKDMKVEFHIEKDAVPIFCKARTVTFPLRSRVKKNRSTKLTV